MSLAELQASSSKRGSKKPPPGSAGRGARKRAKPVSVLVVDDDALSVKLLDVVLRAEGCVVETARSAEEALERLRVFRPDAVVVDLILPLMSGLLFAERLKADPATADITLIAVTAFNGHTTERMALQAGFAAHVRKPIDPTSFADLLFATLEKVR